MKLQFELNGSPFIPLNNLLKVMQLVETGGEANICITDGLVVVNGAVETQKRKKVRAGDVVEFEGATVQVS
jgi:ribosome-associated protein